MLLQDLPADCILLIVQHLKQDLPQAWTPVLRNFDSTAPRPNFLFPTLDVIAMSSTCKSLRDLLWPGIIMNVRISGKPFRDDSIIDSAMRRHVR